MKNKKLLLVATAAMGVLALGTAGVGTVAWFTAQNAQVNRQTAAPTGTLSTSQDSLQNGNFYIVPQVTALNPATLALTDPDGECWAAVNVGDNEHPSYVSAAASTTKALSGTFTITGFKVYNTYSNSEYSDEVTANADALKTIQGNYQFLVSSTQARVRLSQSDNTKFSVGYSSTVSVMCTITNAGAIKWAFGTSAANATATLTVYYSFGGGISTDDDIDAAGVAIAAVDDESSPTGTISVGPAN